METPIIDSLVDLYEIGVNCGIVLGVETTRFETDIGRAILVRETVPAQSKHARHTEISVEVDREAGLPVYEVRAFVPEHDFDNSWVPRAIEWLRSITEEEVGS